MKKQANPTKKGEKKKRQTPKWLKAIGRVLSIILFPLRPFGRYLKGAWQELRKVTWPTNKSASKLTFAVVLFTVVMTVFIVALDFGFEQIVKRILL